MTLSSRSTRRLLAGVAAAALLARPAAAGEAEVRRAPLSGIVRAGGVPVPGAALVVRGVTAGGGIVVKLLKSDADGTFVLGDAAEGLYTVLSVVPGFRPALARLLHRAVSDGALSFVRLDLEAPAGILPEATGGPLDVWIARAVAPGDVLRDVPAVLAALEGGPEQAALPVSIAGRDGRTSALPVRASVASTAGFGAAGASSLSRASLDVSGTAGDRLRWGASGAYARLAAMSGEKTGDASRVAFELASGSMGSSQAIHLSTRQQSVADDVDGARFAAHSLDWNGAVSERSQASVSARLISQSRLLSAGPAADLFARESNAVDVAARYQTELSSSTFARVSVSYRSAMNEFAGQTSPFDRETRAGAVAGVRLLDVFVIEAGGTGDVSERSRGVTPELTLAIATRDGWKIYGFAARRLERRLDGEMPLPGEAGTDEADLTRRSRTLYKAGLRWQSSEGENVSIEASRRELTGTYRLLFDPDFLDRLDSLYFFANDVATDVSFGAAARLGKAFDGRVAMRAGKLSGQREGAIQSDDATWGVAQAAIRVRATDTSLGMGYRVVMQSLTRGTAVLHNDVEAVDLTLGQSIPLAALRSIGSDLRALFSLEFGKRREGEDEEKLNRRLAGGFAVSF
ncbi:MAG TPA: carboxypeptidase-like regulatory domain-containing protein [Thermoanaerobaculia bacterium]|nr:carboxypeptidase-like regulatory domain-containing protein [Thermoanaerobaculia bacterium]